MPYADTPEARDRQRTLAQRLVLSALQQQDVARDAVQANSHAQHLAKASRALSMSLDESATRDAVRKLSLPRPGTWCIVDLLEPDGTILRLPVEHPDPVKQQLARALEQLWPGGSSSVSGRTPVSVSSLADVAFEMPTVVTHESAAALLQAAHGPSNLRILREIGFGAMLVVPLIMRAQVHGAITFVSREGDAPFMPDEIALAIELSARSAMALDNARLYREANSLRLVAETANLSKSQFLGSMSHELRTPLNAIGGFTDLLEMGLKGPVTEEQREALRRIKANQQHLLKLITQILDFARAETGRLNVRAQPVPVAALLREVGDMLSGAVSDRGMHVEIPLCEPEPFALGDPDLVRQILVNLVMNAVKYSVGDGGTITLSCYTEGDTCHATVTDTGPGIPVDMLGWIFEPFVQLTASLKDRRGGVGLGLAISRDLARAMHGDLTVESTPGVGSKFTVSLPLAPESRGGKQGKEHGI